MLLRALAGSLKPVKGQAGPPTTTALRCGYCHAAVDLAGLEIFRRCGHASGRRDELPRGIGVDAHDRRHVVGKDRWRLVVSRYDVEIAHRHATYWLFCIFVTAAGQRYE